jgi:hypothetical protein
VLLQDQLLNLLPVLAMDLRHKQIHANK